MMMTQVTQAATAEDQRKGNMKTVIHVAIKEKNISRN